MSLQNLNSCNNEFLYAKQLNLNILDSSCNGNYLDIGVTGASVINIGGATTPVYVDNVLWQGYPSATNAYAYYQGVTGGVGATGATANNIVIANGANLIFDNNQVSVNNKIVYNNATGEFTLTLAGTYQIDLGYTSDGGGGGGLATLYANGVRQPQLSVCTPYNATNNYATTISISGIYQANANDILVVKNDITGGTTLNLTTLGFQPTHPVAYIRIVKLL